MDNAKHKSMLSLSCNNKRQSTMPRAVKNLCLEPAVSALLLLQLLLAVRAHLCVCVHTQI